MSLDRKAKSSTGEYSNRLGSLNHEGCMWQKATIKEFIQSRWSRIKYTLEYRPNKAVYKGQM